MSHPGEWRVDPVERLKMLFGDGDGGVLSIGAAERFTYSIDFGQERLRHTNAIGGGLDYQGSYHPEDGMCHAEPDVVDGRDGTCVHCGRTLL